MKIFITKNKNLIYKISAAILLIIAWQLAAIFFPFKFLIASPYTVIIKLASLLKDLKFYRSIFYSFMRIIAGFFISILIGVSLALISHLNSFLNYLNDYIMNIFKATPLACIIVILLIIFSGKYVSIITVILACSPIIYTNFLKGLNTADKNLLEMAKIFEFSKSNKYKYIYMESAKSYFLSSIELTSSMAWKASIAAEILAFPKISMGTAVRNAKIFLDMDTIFAFVVAIIVFSKLSSIISTKFFAYFYDKTRGVS